MPAVLIRGPPNIIATPPVTPQTLSEITGASAQQAEFYLQSAHGDLEVGWRGSILPPVLLLYRAAVGVPCLGVVADCPATLKTRGEPLDRRPCRRSTNREVQHLVPILALEQVLVRERDRCSMEGTTMTRMPISRLP